MGTSMKNAPISLAIGIRPGNSASLAPAHFGAVANDRPESTPRLYNLLEIARDHSWVKVHTRHMRKDGGAWEGWAVWPGTGPYDKRTYYTIDLTALSKNP